MSLKPEHYDWAKDPKEFKKENNGHIPHNRCFYCGFRFLGSQYAAFCNICDNYMTPDPEQLIFVVTQRPPKGAKDSIAAGGEGHWTTRRHFVANRIRIPENEDENLFKKKMEAWQKEQLEKHEAEFKKASEFV